MNIKQKMIEAMLSVEVPEGLKFDIEAMLDAALGMLADPANWTPEVLPPRAPPRNSRELFAAVINHIRSLP